MLRNLLKWARRDPKVALLLLANLTALVLVIGLAFILLSPLAAPKNLTILDPDSSATTSPGGAAIIAPTPTAEPSTTPLPPTVNPTRLANLPNQGRNDAPPPPPAQLAISATTASTRTKINLTPSPSTTPTKR